MVVGTKMATCFPLSTALKAARMATSVFPNPTSDLLNIELLGESADQPATIKLYGINGILIYQEDLAGSSTIELSGLNLSTGVYLLRIQTENQVHTRKIVFR